MTGDTSSSDFPTKNEYQGEKRRFQDAFVTKLSPDGSTLIYSTFLGGSGSDYGLDISVDASGSAYVTGETLSGDFPTQKAFQGIYRGGDSGGDAFVTKLNPNGNGLRYSTFLGGSGDDWGEGIAVDSSGSVYVAGATTPADKRNHTSFVTKLNPRGNSASYSLYVAENNDSVFTDIAIDASGSAYVTGRLNLSAGEGYGGVTDACVAKFSPDGDTTPIYEVYVGGSGIDEGWSIAVDASGSAYITGATNSRDFLTYNAYQQSFGGETGIFLSQRLTRTEFEYLTPHTWEEILVNLVQGPRFESWR